MLRLKLLEYYGMVARFGHQECARPKLPFRALKFSPSSSLCCAFQRDIHAPSVRLNLLADLPRQVHNAPVYGCHSQHDRLLRSSKIHQRRHLSVTSPWCFPLRNYPSPIPELNIIMSAQYNVRNSPPHPSPTYLQ